MSESYPIIAPRDDLSIQFHVTKFLTSNTPKFSHHTILLKPREKPRPKLKAYINLAKKSKKEKEALFAAHNVEIDPKDLKWRMEDKKNKRSYIGEPEISKEQGSQFALLVLKNNEFILRPVDFLQFRPEATYRVMSLEEAESEMKSRREGKRWKDRVTLLDKGMEKDKKEKVAGNDDDLALGNSKDDLMKVKKEIDDESAFVEYGEGTTSAKLAARRRNKEAAIDFREKFDDDEEDEPVSDRDYSEEEDEVDLGFDAMPSKPGGDEKKQEKDDSSEEEDEDDESEGEEFDENESLSEDSDDENDKKKDTKSKKRGREETATGTTSSKKVRTEEGHAPAPTGSILEEVLDIAAERGVLERAIRAEFATNGSRGMTIIELTSRLKNKVANLNATRKKIIVGIMKDIARMQQEPGTKQPILYLKS